MKRIFSGWLAALALVLFSPFLAAQTALVVGQDYSLISPPMDTDNPAKIEVTMFFSFACGHCKELDRQLPAWMKKLPADIEFKRVPVGFGNPFYQLMARFYYALEAMGKVDAVHGKVFDALQVERKRLDKPEVLFPWIAEQGVDRAKFEEAYKSFGVAGKLRRAVQLQEAYGVEGTPALGIAGRYYTDGSMAGGFDNMLRLTNTLVEQARKAG